MGFCCILVVGQNINMPITSKAIYIKTEVTVQYGTCFAATFIESNNFFLLVLQCHIVKLAYTVTFTLVGVSVVDS